MTSKPIAVLISDVHYSLKTLELADAAMRQAIQKANELELPLIVAGDLHDTKANMRAECINAMLATFKMADQLPIVLVGNHDRINEKADAHSLEFLSKHAQIINRFRYPKSHTRFFNVHFAAYHHDLNSLREQLHNTTSGSIVIMHQGLQGSDSGDYFQDPTALRHEDVAHLRVISGHYHRRQDIDTGKGNIFSYVGNPYTLGFGEANHPAKGFQILNSDGSLTFVPTNLRRHVILTIKGQLSSSGQIMSEDLVWVKADPGYTKEQAAEELHLDGDFKFEIVADEQKADTERLDTKESPEAILDGMIDSLSNTSSEQKERLKTAWKGLY